MPEGIKLSNQLYPATAAQILSQAEYIHDSSWNNELWSTNTEIGPLNRNRKDQQSINAKLLNKIDTSIQDLRDDLNGIIEEQLTPLLNLVDGISDDLGELTGDVQDLETSVETKFGNLNTYINTVTLSILNSITTGPGLIKDTSSTITYDENNKITGISNSRVSIMDTIYSLNRKDSDNYSGFISGFTRGDADLDGVVGISDVTLIIDTLLEKNTVDLNPILIILNVTDLEKPYINVLEDLNGDHIFSFSDTLSDDPDTYSCTKFVIGVEEVSGDGFVNPYENENTNLENRFNMYNSYYSNNLNKLSLPRTTTTTKEYMFKIYFKSYFDDLNREIPISGHTLFDLKVDLVKEAAATYNIVKLFSTEDSNDYIDVDIFINDTDNVLGFDADLDNELGIADITAVIDYVLTGEWNGDDSIYEAIVGDYTLKNNDNLAMLTCPGILYKGINEDGSHIYFEAQSYNQNNKLHPILFNRYNLNLFDILTWFRNTILIDNESNLDNNTGNGISMAGPSSNITVSFTKYTDNLLYEAFYNENILNNLEQRIQLLNSLFINTINVTDFNLIYRIPIYLYKLENTELDTNLLTISYTLDYTDSKLHVTLEDNPNIYIVDSKGEKIDELIVSNINPDYPVVFLNIKFNVGVTDNYRYINLDGGYYEFRDYIDINMEEEIMNKRKNITNKVIDASLEGSPLKLNCKTTSLM